MYETRAKMPPSHRAKQFMPFAAVKGLQEALRAKEKIYLPKNEIAEDEADSINMLLGSLMPGSYAEITYLNGGEYKSVSGTVLYMDTVKRRLALDEYTIGFSDIVFVAVPEYTEDTAAY